MNTYLLKFTVVFLALLLPTISLAQQPCDAIHTTDSLYAIKRYITPASIIGTDDRMPISETYKQNGLTDQEYRQSLTSTGVIYCPTVDGKIVPAAASVAGAKNTIVTAAHIFSEENGTPRPIERCYFATYAHPDDHIPISVAPGDFNLGRNISDHKLGRGDFGLIRLSRPVKDSSPYEFGWNERPISGSEKMVVLSSNYNGKNGKMYKEPKVQSCSATKSFGDDGQGRSVFETDCDTSPGDSGGLNLVRNAEGHLLIRGITRGDVGGSTDYCEYNDNDCASVSVEFRSAALDMFRSVVGGAHPTSSSSLQGQDL